MVKGVPLKQAAADIAAKYPGTSIQSVQTDWQRRRKWLPDLVNVGDSTVFEQAFFGLKELIPMAWVEFSRAPAGTTVKNRALALLIDVYCHLISILQDSGFAPKAPLQLETTQRLDLNDDDIWDELTEDEKRQLIAASEIYSRHRNARRQGASASTFTADPDGKRALIEAAEAEKAALTNLRNEEKVGLKDMRDEGEQ
jgi:hypothetical protein